MSGLFAGVTGASWLTSFTLSCMQPAATAGSLGYGALGFVLWVQKVYFTGQTTSPQLAATYRTFTESFAWAGFHAK